MKDAMKVIGKDLRSLDVPPLDLHGFYRNTLHLDVYGGRCKQIDM